MWFEARKQEKKLRSIMIDHKKRAERRQEFYERIKREPAEFMQIHGSRYKIQVDLNFSKDYETAALRPLQWDSSTLIDRFDARAHLDFMPEYKESDPDEEFDYHNNDDERRRSLYERYRILIVNEFEKVVEEKFLKQIFLEEHYGTSQQHSTSKLVKEEAEKKKKLAEQKAAIAFTYEDSTDYVQGKQEDQQTDDSSTESDEESEPEFDITLDVEGLNPEEVRALDKIAVKYWLSDGDFIKFMWEDKMEQQEMEEQKKMEEAKSSLSGKKSRRERQMLKQEKLLMISGTRDFTTNLSYAKIESPSRQKRYRSSSSRSPTPAKDRKVEKIEYITSFGGEKESDEGDGPPVQGPAAPPQHYQRLLELRKKKSMSPDFGPKLARRRSSRSRSKSGRGSRARRRSRSGDRSRGRYRDRDSRHSFGKRKSRSRSSSRRRRRSSRSQSRRVSYRKSRSSTRRSHSRSRDGRSGRKRDYDYSRSKSPSRRSASRKSLSKLEKEEKPIENLAQNAGTLKKECSPGPVVVEEKREEIEMSEEKKVDKENENEIVEESESSSSSSGDGNESSVSMLSIRSSMSESEQERRQVENRRRRIRRTKRDVKLRRSKLQKNGQDVDVSIPPKPAGGAQDAVSTVGAADKSGGKHLSVSEKLKLQTQRALKKTLAKDKEEALEKRRETIKGQIERDEEMREISSLLRKKERLKRQLAREEYERLYEEERKNRRRASSSDSDSSHGRKRHSRSSRRRRRRTSRSTSKEKKERRKGHSEERKNSSSDAGKIELKGIKLVDY